MHSKLIISDEQSVYNRNVICKGAKWLVTTVRVQTAVLPLLGYNPGSPSIVE